MPNNQNFHFNFKQPLINASYFQQYLKAKEEVIRKALMSKKKRSLTEGVLWFLVAVLCLSLGALGYISYGKYEEGRSISQQTAAQPQVAGVLEEMPKNIISGDNFSILTNQKTPEGFTLTKKEEKSSFLDKASLSSEFLVRKNKDGKELTSGLKISSVQFDNKLDKKGFDELVISKLGADFSLKSQDINLPNNIKLSKIESDQSNQVYYTAVTSNYYYVIQISQETSAFPEFEEINKFVESFLGGLYLN